IQAFGVSIWYIVSMKMVLTSLLILLAWPASAQTAYEELQAIMPARVEAILDERVSPIMGTDATAVVQTVSARVLEGERMNQVVTFENDLVTLGKGDRIFLSHIRDIDGTEIYLLKDVDRGSGLLVLLALFVALLLLFAGWQGARALGSLCLSIIGIVFVLLPALLSWYDPFLMSLLIYGVILALALFGTHGFNPVSTIAFGGTVAAVLATSAIAWWFVNVLRLSGYG